MKDMRDMMFHRPTSMNHSYMLHSSNQTFVLVLLKKVVGLERGPLSLVSTTEELLDRKVVAPI
jgi:hypothetical protein